jgi:uncharacterized surface protein with fasciclin (FAS1) repeats
LVPTLEGAGPFTVFAPTNEAFAALPAGVLANFLKPENKADLVKLLTYHVVSGKILAASITNNEVINTVQGQRLIARLSDGKVFLQDMVFERNLSQVIQANVNASNGVVHVINKVLMPAF